MLLLAGILPVFGFENLEELGISLQRRSGVFMIFRKKGVAAGILIPTAT